MDDLSPLIPKGADFFGVPRDLKPIGDWKRKVQLFAGLFRLVHGVYRKSKDLHVLLFEFFNMGLEIGQLPTAVRSPAAAIEDENRVLSCEIPREMKRPSIHGLDFILGKKIANV